MITIDRMKHALRTHLPGPKARRFIQIIKDISYDSTFTYPLVIANGDGCRIKDVDGNIFLDFSSNIGTCPLGYSHPDIVQILKEYSVDGMHRIAGQDFYCEEHAMLAQSVVSITPKYFKSFFINSGAEAVENAIKIAYKKMGPLPGVSCINAFHGRTLGALSFTFSKPVQKNNFPELPVKRIKFCVSENDPDIDSVRKILSENKVAFVICEVIQGEGGIYVASRSFVRALRKYSSEFGVPLILDEVQSGMGRTGKWWAFEHYGVKPDIITVAKALQVGATLYDRKLDPEEQGVLSSTWGAGSRIDMAIGKRIIDIIKRDSLLANATTMGDILKKGLVELVGGRGIIDVRGIGMMLGIEFDTEVTRTKKIVELFRNGILVLPAGRKSIRIMPPLIITKEEIQEGLSIINTVLAKSF